jgi:hypothetical protein
VRECPNCHRRFFKVEGCNNMSCPCGTHICYICRKNITGEGKNSHGKGYNHFCQTPHCEHKRCGRCILFSDAVADDRLAMKEAGMKALASASEANELDVSGRPVADIAALLEQGPQGPVRKKARI